MRPRQQAEVAHRAWLIKELWVLGVKPGVAADDFREGDTEKLQRMLWDAKGDQRAERAEERAKKAEERAEKAEERARKQLRATWSTVIVNVVIAAAAVAAAVVAWYGVTR